MAGPQPLLGVGFAFYALLAVRVVRTFVLTRRHADLLVAVGIRLARGGAAPAMLMGSLDLCWWLGRTPATAAV